MKAFQAFRAKRHVMERMLPPALRGGREFGRKKKDA